MSTAPPEGQPVQPYPAVQVVPVAQSGVPVPVVVQPVQTVAQTHHEAEHASEQVDHPRAVYVLGLGSGDIEISTTGAKRETVHIPNVLFVDSKVAEIQQMIAMRPDMYTPPPPQ
jgi:hypothetical protein